MADKILIVDDDPAIRKLLEKVMRSNEMETTAADSGTAASCWARWRGLMSSNASAAKELRLL